ncbi:hypothetical protein, partial [Escherichia coli]|uniref:hypothetical protein n=1 Tax=Escherichia coli TaxID=562 RepID=UPI001BC9CC87
QRAGISLPEGIPAAADIVNLRYKSCSEMEGQDHPCSGPRFDESDARNAYINALSIGKGGIDAGRMSADLRTTCKKYSRICIKFC